MFDFSVPARTAKTSRGNRISSGSFGLEYIVEQLQKVISGDMLLGNIKTEHVVGEILRSKLFVSELSGSKNVVGKCWVAMLIYFV